MKREPPQNNLGYLREFGVHAQQTVEGGMGVSPVYLHGRLSDATTSYTAFGQGIGAAVPIDFPRYRYGGGWGYESGLLSLQGPSDFLAPVALQHVGWRWYQPNIGRFIQRDPIGVVGGLNVYTYCMNLPTMLVDPLGLWPFRDDWVGTGPWYWQWWLNLTGGAHSWLDSPKVETVAKVSAGVGMTIVPGGLAVRWGFASGRWVALTIAAGGKLSLGTHDPGFLRWGPGWVPRDDTAVRIFRIAVGGPKGGWPFHVHIHQYNWWAPWNWFCRP